jgi:hypothetical protein
MQFIIITKHKHMYINTRIIQKTKQKIPFFPFSFHFFSFFVNRYDIICIHSFCINSRIIPKKRRKTNLFSLLFPPFSSFFTNISAILWCVLKLKYTLIDKKNVVFKTMAIKNTEMRKKLWKCLLFIFQKIWKFCH